MCGHTHIVITLRFLNSYSKHKSRLLSHHALKGYRTEFSSTDSILDGIIKDPRSFELITNLVYDNLKELNSGDAFKYLRSIQSKREENSLEFISGCTALAIIHTISESTELNELREEWVPKYQYINLLSTHLNNLKVSLYLANAIDYHYTGCSRSLAFLILSKLTSANVFCQKTLRVGGRTEHFLCKNIQVGSHKVNLGRIFYETPCIHIIGGNPFYLSEHFTEFSSVITNNSNNTFRSSTTDDKAIRVLSEARFSLDPVLVKEVLNLLVNKFPELKAVNTSSQALDLLTRLMADGRYGNEGKDLIGELDEDQDESPDTGTIKTRLSHKLIRSGRKLWGAKAREDTIMSHLYNLYGLLLLKESCRKDGFSYRFTMDFRGRIYCDSVCGYTYNKLVRYCIKYDDYGDDSVSSATLERWESELSELCENALEVKFSTQFKAKGAINCLFELGKLVKSKHYRMSYSDFVSSGIEVYKGISELTDLEGLIVRNYYKRAISYILDNNNSGHIFYKDATASGLQVLGLLLGCKDENIATHLNFKSQEFWYDPYSFLIETFKKKYTVPDQFTPYFTRKHLKKTIMIINYRGSFIKCWSSFVESTGITKEEVHYEHLLAHFGEFFKFLLKVFEGDEFFKNKSENLIALLNGSGDITREADMIVPESSAKDYWRKRLLRNLSCYQTVLHADVVSNVIFESIKGERFEGAKNFEIIMSDGFKVSYNYMKQEFKRIEVRPRDADEAIAKKWSAEYADVYIKSPIVVVARSTVKLVTASMDLDLRRTERAFRANITHSADALLIRKIITATGADILSIHDCIGIGLLGIRQLRENAKQAYCELEIACGNRQYIVRNDITGDFLLN